MKFRKKTVIIDAEQFTDESKDQVKNWVTCHTVAGFEDGKPILIIKTLEGDMITRLSDWVIKAKGEFYPIKDDILWLTHEKVEDKA